MGKNINKSKYQEVRPIVGGIVQIISTVGFPIAACLGLGYFVFKFASKIREDSINRENKLMEYFNNQNQVLVNINANMDRMSTTLENMNERLIVVEQKVELK